MKLSYIAVLLARINAHAGFKRYFANTSWMMGEKIVRMIVALVVGTYVARYLGPERFGLLNYATSFVGLFSALATLGLDGIVVRNLVQSIEYRDRLLGTAFTLKLGGGVLLFGVVFFAVQFTSSDAYAKMLVLIIAGGMILQSFKVVDFYFQSQILGRLTSIAGLCSLFASSIVKLILIFSHASLTCFALEIVLETGILGSMLFFLYVKQKIRILTWRFELDMAKELLRDSWPLILSGFAITFYMKIDQVMIKEMMGNTAVGSYAAAVRLSEVWYFIPVAINNSFFPAIINAKKKNENLYYQRLQSLYNLMVWLSVGIAIPTTFLSPLIINLLYGQAYISSANVLSIHIWAGVFVFLNNAAWKWYLIENKLLFANLRLFIGLITNVCLNFCLIPAYGIEGAAIATLISRGVASYLGNILFKESWILFRQQTKALFFFNLLNKK
ncbi:flippase [Desulfobacter vibrioformis]|uniref:flippase n=1 Tax=Desulfobacter vibrioformis TaxID=34031 RepID=UPI00068D80E4|nr:flippase [Desulfobacter vibrioformis]